MPIKRQLQIKAWSYSRLVDYKQCPLRAKLKYIDRASEPGSAAMDRGALIHEEAAAYVRGELKRLPNDLKLFKQEFQVLKKLNAATPLAVEMQWAFTDKWAPCDWFGPQAWCRMVLDVVTPHIDGAMRIIDHNTGRNRFEEQRPQLSLYAVGGFMRYPEVNEITTEFWYTDQGELCSDIFYRKDLLKLKALWAGEVKALLRDHMFAPRPSDKCRWCHYSKAKVGLCPY